MSWEPTEFLTASFHGPHKVPGYTYRGLGLYLSVRGSPKGRRPPKWCLVHLGSGHSICWIDGTVATAFPKASEIAECIDWDFEGLDGWKNTAPDMPVLVGAIMKRHGGSMSRGGGVSDREVAREITMARLG